MSKLKRYTEEVELKKTESEGRELSIKAKAFMTEDKEGEFISILDLPYLIRVILRLN